MGAKKLKQEPLPENTDALLAHGEAMATILADKRRRLGIGAEAEALLRSTIAAATFAIDTHLAVLAAVRKPGAPAHLLAEAKLRCDGKSARLRRRVRRSITRLSRHLRDRDLMRTAEYVLSLST